MFSGRASKPLVSALLALLLVLAFVLPFLQLDFLAGPSTPWDIVQAGSIRWAVILTVGLVWLGVQLFWKASISATKLGLAVSATILWLALTFFFNFEIAGYGGAAAFFALMGGLGVTLLWTYFMADEVSF